MENYALYNNKIKKTIRNFRSRRVVSDCHVCDSNCKIMLLPKGGCTTYICLKGAVQIFYCSSYIHLSDNRRASCIYSSETSHDIFTFYYSCAHNVFYQISGGMSVLSKMGCGEHDIIARPSYDGFKVGDKKITTTNGHMSIEHAPELFEFYHDKSLRWQSESAAEMTIPIIDNGSYKILIYSEYPKLVTINSAPTQLKTGWGIYVVNSEAGRIIIATEKNINVYIDEISKC